jgi:hypothetical protein
LPEKDKILNKRLKKVKSAWLNKLVIIGL